MNIRNAFLSAVGWIALAASLGAAIAQTVVLPQVVKVDADDLVQVIKHGMPTAQSRYATAAQVNGPIGYQTSTPLTAFSLAFAAGQTMSSITPAGTLGNGTFTLAANPGNGQELHALDADSVGIGDHRWRYVSDDRVRCAAHCADGLDHLLPDLQQVQFDLEPAVSVRRLICPGPVSELAAKHNKKLSGAAASEAAAQATAMIKHGVPEGEAIATADEHAEKPRNKPESLFNKKK